jgi:hypothetical protein
VVYQWASLDQFETLFLERVYATRFSGTTSLTIVGESFYVISSYLSNPSAARYPVQSFAIEITTTETTETSGSRAQTRGGIPKIVYQAGIGVFAGLWVLSIIFVIVLCRKNAVRKHSEEQARLLFGVQ